jgi:hypothetical protein
MSKVRVIGVRHHSPACARLVRRTIAAWQPQAVLIEGPSDFNPRLAELLLEHQLPLALYSYANQDGVPARCWFPLLDHSPEWVALRGGQAAGALLRFIDLPHWRYRTLSDEQRRTGVRPRSRYAEVSAVLCRRFGCDSDEALWDHLFESVGTEDAAADDELAGRLDLYFAELRGDDPGTAQDQAREAQMAQWIAWAAARLQRVLVVCGGWHKPALERAWPLLAQADEPATPQPADERAAGCYLVPYAYRQVDALGGYAAGMASPMYYQWLWQHGAAVAARRAVSALVQRLRARRVPLSTADFIAFEQAAAGLARLRGHAVPLRIDLLDALQSALLKEAQDQPPPWSVPGLLGPQHHPVLREALLALTGEGSGHLHGDTPLPQLLHDVAARCAACGIAPTREGQTLVLDRRRTEDTPRARLLWQLQVLGVGGARLVDTRAPHAARGLAPALRFEEHWRLQQDERWFPDLIEAAVHGATLEAAARQCLLLKLDAAGDDPAALTQGLLQAIRAGLSDLGDEAAARLAHGLAHCHDHGALAAAAQSLAQLCQAGFWGDDPRGLLEATLVHIAERLLWLLEGRAGPGSPQQLQADVQAVAVFDRLLPLALEGLDAGFVRETLARLARSAAMPPALRGAALGVAFVHDGLGARDAGTAADAQAASARAEVLAITRTMAPRDALGDFLFGLFGCARALATESDAIVLAVQAALSGMGDEDFLVALPQLRGAFGWFPPRERGQLAALIARHLGLDRAHEQQLLALRGGVGALLDARRVEAQALAWAREIGLDSGQDTGPDSGLHSGTHSGKDSTQGAQPESAA